MANAAWESEQADPMVQLTKHVRWMDATVLKLFGEDSREQKRIQKTMMIVKCMVENPPGRPWLIGVLQQTCRGVG